MTLYDDIDPGIRALVHLLRDHGWNTTYSCQGGEGHAEKCPTIEIDLQKLDDVEPLAIFLTSHEKEHGFRSFQIVAMLRCPSDGFWDRRATLTLGTIMPIE